MRFKVEPWAHQRLAIERARAFPEFALFFDMGTGKTCTSINIAREKYVKHGRLLRTLIIAPPIVLENWRREWLAHSEVDAAKIRVLSGHHKKRTDDFSALAFDKPGLQRKAWISRGGIFITNYEALLMPDLWKELSYWKPELLIFDEAHRLKDMHSKRTKAAIKLADDSTYRLLLTGTPILNSPLDIFALYRILDRGQTFGHSFVQFRAKYFYDANAQFQRKQSYFPNWQPKPDCEAGIRQSIEAKSMTVEKKTCLTLPPLLKKTLNVELSPEQRRLYEAMKKDFIAYLGSSACVATLAITRALRLMQIVSGYVALQGWSPTEVLTTENVQIHDNPRAKALRELLEEILPTGEKVIIWAVFKDNYVTIRNILDSMKAQYVEVHGEVSARNKIANVDLFNAAKGAQVLLGHPGSAGIGINMVAASYSIFYSRGFSLEHDLQAEARNYRGGSEIHERITRIDLVAPGTIDEQVLERLRQKLAVSEAIIKDLGKDLADEQRANNGGRTGRAGKPPV